MIHEDVSYITARNKFLLFSALRVFQIYIFLTHISFIITYLLTPRCRALLEKLTGLQLVKKFPAFHGTRRFITALTSVRHLFLSWASPIQSIYPHPTSWRPILILSTHLYLGLPSGLFPSGFPTKNQYTSLSSPIRATCPAHLILLDFITCTILGEVYKSFSTSLCNLLHSPVTSSLLGPNILLNTMFSNTLSFFSSRNVSDQVWHSKKKNKQNYNSIYLSFIIKFSDKTLSPFGLLHAHLILFLFVSLFKWCLSKRPNDENHCVL